MFLASHTFLVIIEFQFILFKYHTSRINMRLQSLLLILVSVAYFTRMAEPASVSSDSSKSPAQTAVHIVYTERAQDNEEPEAYHLRTLSSVLGSEEAAKEALLYSYKTAACGFSAKLTPEQVEEISKLPGVLQVVPSRTLELHSGAGNQRQAGPARLQ